ncbi:MAG TPA: ThuA domain-containing protein [Roseimicrobium sp.]|nr:ThuA domain-containing protein [Roseimicrobium sp.]
MRNPFSQYALAAAAALLATCVLAAAPKKVLVLTQSKGFVHSVVKRPSPDELCLVEKTMIEIAGESGVFVTENSQDAIASLTKENLKQYDALFFYTTGTLLPAGEPREALLDFVKSGKGFIGVHSSSDTFADFKGYVDMINGNFGGHPWGSGTMVTYTNHEPKNAITAMYGDEFSFKEETYQYKPGSYNPDSVRVLISLNMTKTEPKMPWHVPVCWVREFGDGRLFYTNFGHNESTWKDAKFHAHLIAGIRWALKLDQGPATPNPEVQAVETIKSFAVTVASLVGQPSATLSEKLVAKAGKDAKVRQSLVAAIGEFRKLPTPDPKKATPEDVDKAQAARSAAASKIVADAGI